MQDRFKFRVWYEGLGMTDCFCLHANGELIAFMNQEWESISDPKIHVMQYTGLKDKNGKLIYEGDILRYSFSEEDFDDFPVIWEKSVLTWWREDELLSGLNFDCIEIIGNIYENPELMK